MSEENSDEVFDELKSYRKALEEEFLADVTEPITPKRVKEKMGGKMLTDALAQLHLLVNHADSESVRANVAKFIVEKNMQELKTMKDAEEVDSLIERMRS